MKCSFCDEPLICKSCRQPVRPLREKTHLAIYQPDMEVVCPECKAVLTCLMCGYVYGDPDEEDEPGHSNV